MNKFILIIILSFAGGVFVGALKSYLGFDYAHIACIFGIVIWANQVADKIRLDMDLY